MWGSTVYVVLFIYFYFFYFFYAYTKVKKKIETKDFKNYDIWGKIYIWDT